MPHVVRGAALSLRRTSVMMEEHSKLMWDHQWNVPTPNSRRSRASSVHDVWTCSALYYIMSVLYTRSCCKLETMYWVDRMPAVCDLHASVNLWARCESFTREFEIIGMIYNVFFVFFYSGRCIFINSSLWITLIWRSCSVYAYMYVHVTGRTC